MNKRIWLLILSAAFLMGGCLTETVVSQGAAVQQKEQEQKNAKEQQKKITQDLEDAQKLMEERDKQLKQEQ